MGAVDRELRLYAFMQPMLEKMTAEIPDEQFHVLPDGGGNSPNWITGHLAVVQDFTVGLLGGAPQLDDAWRAKYGPGSSPSDDPGAIESKRSLLDAFRATSAAMRSAILAAPDDALLAEQTTPLFREQLPTVADLLGHILTTHFALHIGQLSAWRRSRGMASFLQMPPR